jgi:hypothetical protein
VTHRAPGGVPHSGTPRNAQATGAPIVAQIRPPFLIGRTFRGRARAGNDLHAGDTLSGHIANALMLLTVPAPLEVDRSAIERRLRCALEMIAHPVSPGL